MADISGLAELIRQSAYRSAGGLSQQDMDAPNRILNPIVNASNAYNQAIKDALQRKKTELENQQLQGENAELPSVFTNVPKDYKPTATLHQLKIGEAARGAGALANLNAAKTQEFGEKVWVNPKTNEISSTPRKPEEGFYEVSPKEAFGAAVKSQLAKTKDETKQLPPEQIDFYANAVVNGSPIVKDLFQRNPIASLQINKRAAEMLMAQGKTPEAMALNQANYKASQVALDALQKQSTLVTSFEQTATANIDAALKRAGQVGRFGVPVADKWKQWLQGKIAGDADVAAMEAAMHVAANEIAKVTSTQTGNVVPEQERIEYRRLMDTALTMEGLTNVADVVKTDMQNRLIGYEDQKRQLLSTMYGGGEKYSNGAPPAATQQPNPTATVTPPSVETSTPTVAPQPQVQPTKPASKPAIAPKKQQMLDVAPYEKAISDAGLKTATQAREFIRVHYKKSADEANKIVDQLMEK